MERGSKRGKLGTPKVDTQAGLLIVPEAGGKVAHEVSLEEVRKWLRFRYVSTRRDVDSVIRRTYRASECLKPALAAVFPEVQKEADTEREPAAPDAKTRIYASARALDEALYEGYFALRESLRAKYDTEPGARPLDPADLDRLMQKEAFHEPRIQGDHVVIDIAGIDYGTTVAAIRASKPTDTPEGEVLSRGFVKVCKFVKAASK